MTDGILLILLICPNPETESVDYVKTAEPLDNVIK